MEDIIKFKKEGNWKAAADCLLEINTSETSNLPKALNYLEAATLLAKCADDSYAEKIIDCYKNSIKIFNSICNMRRCGEANNKLATYFKDRKDYVSAIKYYQEAFKCYDVSDASPSDVIKNKNKCAYCNCLLKNYEEAIALYEDILIRCKENSLLKFTISKYVNSLVLCVLAKDGKDAASSCLSECAKKYGKLLPSLAVANISSLLTQQFDDDKLLVKIGDYEL